MIDFLKNYFSTIFFIILIYLFYSNQNYYISYLKGDFSFAFLDFSLNIKDVFLGIIIGYIIALIPFYLIEKEKSKARIILEFIYKKVFRKEKIKIQKEEKTAILAWLVKGFFAPLMIFWLTGHIFNMTNNIYFTLNNISLFSVDFLYFFNKYFFYMMFSIILFFDVLFFTLGYLIEGKIFNNNIKSVEPTILGWLVTLISYPPFNTAANNMIGWYSLDFPQFDNFYLHIFLNIFILFLMGIFSRSSISLGLKASNLTNRGIITSGPYKFVRHPAYFCKNIAWWIGGLPILISSILNFDFKTFIFAFLSLSTWSFIYYLRAKTEENHLSLDKDYINYKKKVKYMFLPGIF